MDRTIDERAIRDVVRRWWRDLTDAANAGLNRRRGALARLRRIDLEEGPAGPAPDVIAAMTEEAFRDLCRAVEPHYSLHQLRDDRIEDLVTAAVTLARIRDEPRGPTTTARLLGGRDDDGRKMKEGRFLGLMRAETSADLFDQARRLPDLLDGTAPVGELGASLLLWRRVPRIRRNWARDYYGLDLGGRESAAPAATPSNGA